MVTPSNNEPSNRIKTGISNLDYILQGGLPRGSITVLAGPPGSGKTILSQEIGFHHAATTNEKVIFFQTLSEPTAKRLQFLSQFNFYDPKKINKSIQFYDLGATLRSQGPELTLKSLMEHVQREEPALVMIDSFRAFDDFVESSERHRNFSYETIVKLMAWDCTVLLLGEFTEQHFNANPLFSVVDGLIVATQAQVAGEQRRVMRVVKMRGTNHNRDPHTFRISSSGIKVFAPKVAFEQDVNATNPALDADRCKTGNAGLDSILGDGIARGSSLLVSGVAGTGKTIALLEFIYRGATEFGERGLYVSFEETREQIIATGRQLGWDIQAVIDQGVIEIVYIPQTAILVEEHLLMIRNKMRSFEVSRLALDSLSVFLGKVDVSQMVREVAFQFSSMVQATGAVGMFTTNIPYGSPYISRYGVEETILDGVILLSSEVEGLKRRRYLEVLKLRNTSHQVGRHEMTIGQEGISIANGAAQDAP